MEALIAKGSPALDKGGLARIVARLESSTLDLGKSTGEVAGLAQGRFEENESSIVLVSGAVQNLMAVLGPTVDMDAKFEAPTLWGTTSFIGEEVSRLGDEFELSSANIASIQQALLEVSIRIAKDEARTPGEEEKLKGILTYVMEGVQEVGGHLNLIRNNIASLAETTVDKASVQPEKKRQKPSPTGK